MKSLKLGRPFRDFFSLSLIFIQFKNNNNNNHILFFNKRAIIVQKKKKKVTASYYRNHFTNLVGITNTTQKKKKTRQDTEKKSTPSANKENFKGLQEKCPRAAQCSVQNRNAEIAPAFLPIYNYNFPFDSSNNRLSRPFFYLFFFFSFSKIVTIYC